MFIALFRHRVCACRLSFIRPAPHVVVKARERLEKLSQTTRAAERESLEHEIALANAAKTCQFANVTQRPLNDLLSSARLLSGEDIELPKNTAQLFTCKKAEFLLEQFDVKAWLASVWPRPATVQQNGQWLVPSELGPWNYAEPVWHTLMNCETDCRDSLWTESVFNDAFLDVVSTEEAAANPDKPS